MSDNAPESVSEVDAKTLELGVLHSLTLGIQEGVYHALNNRYILALEQVTKSGRNPTMSEVNSVMNIVVKQLTMNFELVKLIEELLPFTEPDPGDTARKDLVRSAIEKHPLIQRAFSLSRSLNNPNVNS